MKKSELIKIIKEEVENTISELGMPSVMAINVGGATAAGKSAKKASMRKKKFTDHNNKLIDTLNNLPDDKTFIEIEKKDVMLPVGRTFKDLFEILRGEETSSEIPVTPLMQGGKIIYGPPEVHPHRAAGIIKRALINLGAL